MTAAEWIARARAVTDGATPGPWTAHVGVVLAVAANGAPNRVAVLLPDPDGQADAAFIAASRTMLPAAVAAIEAVLAEVETTRTPDGSLLGGLVKVERLVHLIDRALDGLS